MFTAFKNSLLAISNGASSGSIPVRRSSAVSDTSASYPGGARGDDTEENEGGYGRPARPATSPDASSINMNSASIGNSVPRVKHTMTRIKAMMRKLNPEVLDTLSYPAASKQVAELQKLLQDYVIPKDVLEAYAMHDGQDTFSVPRMGENAENEGNTGFIYGLWWMSIEEIIEEYTFWRRLDVSNPPSPVAAKKRNDVKGKGRQHTHTARVPSQDAFLFGSEMDPRTVRATMRSCPEGFVREEYSHPSWLPLLKDGYGNYIGVDLDPPSLSEDDRLQLSSSAAPPILPARGQVIAFGREVDTKTVLWNGWGDSNAYDNLGGGGWARFLASFADDLSATSRLHRDDTRSRFNQRPSAYSYDEDDEDSYRSASGGRQEAISSHRAGTGLEWLDGSPIYSGLGTIEALVERSRRIWGSLGMPMPVSTPAQEIIPLYADNSTPMPNGFSSPQAGIDRSNKPPPLQVNMLNQDDTKHSELSNGRSISHPPSSNAGLQTAMMQGTDISPTDKFYNQNVDADDANTSSTALVQAEGFDRPPLLPEPSLVLSPPSPKGNDERFGHFPSASPPPADGANFATAASQQGALSDPTTPTVTHHPASPQRLSSPNSLYNSNATLQSPARMSPGQAQRLVQRQDRQRTTSGGSEGTSPVASGSSPAARTQRRPPPPAMSLGLPTLEFGNGIWEYGDTSDADVPARSYEKSSFEVVIDQHR